MTLFEGALFTRELMLGDLTAQERDELVQFMAENAPMYGIDPRSVPQTYDQYVCCVLCWPTLCPAMSKLNFRSVVPPSRPPSAPASGQVSGALHERGVLGRAECERRRPCPGQLPHHADPVGAPRPVRDQLGPRRCSGRALRSTEFMAHPCVSVPALTQQPYFCLGHALQVLMPEPIALQFHFKVGTLQYLHTAALFGLVRTFYGLLPDESRQYTMYLQVRDVIRIKRHDSGPVRGR